MNFFRKIAGPMVALISITFLAWMVFDLSGLTGQGSSVRPNAVGKVNGQTLDSREYEAMVEQASQQQQQQNQGALGADDYASLRDQVWNRWVDQAVLLAEYKRRGLTVSDQELADAIRTTPLPELMQNPSFQTNGQFDMSKYQRWLTSGSAVQLLPAMEAEYRGQMLRSKLLRVISADVFVSDAQLWEQYKDEHETVRADIALVVPRDVVPDSAVPVSEAEIAAYYQAHGDDFKRPETGYLSYVMVPRALSAADSTAALQRIEAARAEIAGGAKFEDVARRESEDPVSAARGGDLGEWTKGQMVAAFDSVAAKIPVGQLSTPFLSPFGWHILQITKRDGDKFTGRHILVKIELAGAHRDSVDAVADSLDRIAADRVDPAALDTVAHALGLRIGHTLPVQKGTQVQAGRTVVANAGTWVFQRGEVGAISPLEETDDALYLFRIDSLTPEGIPPLTAIHDGVAFAARQAKKWGKAAEIAQALQKRLDEGATLDMATHALGIRHQIVGPFTRVAPPVPEPAVIGTAFSLQPGQRSKVLDTPSGYYLIELLDHTPADSADFAKKRVELRTAAISTARQERVRTYLQALRDNATIVDRREELMRQSEAAQAAQDAQAGNR